MALSIYEASVPVFLRSFTNLSREIASARNEVVAGRINECELLRSSRGLNLPTFSEHVQNAAIWATEGVARLAALEELDVKLMKAALEDLQVLTADTISYLKSVPRNRVDDMENRTVALPLSSGKLEVPAGAYLIGFLGSKVYTNLISAFALLRMSGVPMVSKNPLSPIDHN